jgi:hypothetical protein
MMSYNTERKEAAIMIKKTILLTGLLFGTGCFTAGFSQLPPPGAGDRSLENRNIKDRSNELERIKRDADKPDTANQQSATMSAAKFQEVKEDFENVQRLEDEIVKVYTTSKQIDFLKISQNAAGINRSAARLESDLFPPDPKPKNGKNAEASIKGTEYKVPGDIKALIVEQDNTLAAFVANPIFTNPKVVSPADNLKAHDDLQRLIRLSAALQAEADRSKK